MKKHLYIFTLLSVFAILILSKAKAQSIGTFTSVEPVAQTQNLVIPSTHTFQRIIRAGSPLTLGGNLGSNGDFTGYVPIGGSSTNGYLSISSESAPAECAILSMSFNASSKVWNVTSSGKVSLPAADIGYCAAFCSGTVTPKNTIMVCEEIAPTGDGNGDGYDDLGWIIEIDPATRTVINQDGAGGVDKLWAMGRQTHENVTIKGDQTVAYWGADDNTNGFLYKFVPTVPGNFSAGNLYVLQSTAAFGTGTWRQVANTTQADRNNTISLSSALGAFNFQRIEDVEIGPDGKVYFSSTATGRVFRLSDAGATVNNLEVFVDNTTFDVDGAGPFAPAKFEWPDNLAFDGEGNLWVLQDGGDNHIWVVSPTHTAAAPAIRVFGNTPSGSEPTGITFSPDYKYLFISIQHPSGGNTTSQRDAAGNDVVFDTHTTLVIARKENLGASVLAVRYINLRLAQKNNGVELNWAAAGATANTSFEIERSTDGINFSSIGSRNSVSPSTYFDNNLPTAANVYYRIHSCNNGGECMYSEVKSLKLGDHLSSIKVYPLSTRDAIHVTYNSPNSADVLLQVYSSNGVNVYKQKRKVTKGVNNFNISVQGLAPGMYVLKMDDGFSSNSETFIK